MIFSLVKKGTFSGVAPNLTVKLNDNI